MRIWASQVAQWRRTLLPMQEGREIQVQSLGLEDPLEKEMATYSIQYSYLGNPMDRGAWQAAFHEVTRSQKHLSDQALTHTRRTYCIAQETLLNALW